MGNRKKRKTLTGVVIALTAMLCLLVGMTLLLEYRSEDNDIIIPKVDIPANPQAGDPKQNPAGEAVNGDISEDVKEKPGKDEELSAGTNGTGEEDPKTEEPKQEKPNREEPNPGENKPTELKPEDSESGGSRPVESRPADEDVETSTRPTESGSAETVPESTMNDNNVTPDDEL